MLMVAEDSGLLTSAHVHHVLKSGMQPMKSHDGS